MKKSVLLGLGAVAMAMGAGAGAVLVANHFGFSSATEARAGDISDMVIYFDYSDVKSDWGDPSNIYARYWDGSKVCYELCSATEKADVVTFTYSSSKCDSNGFTFRNSDSGQDDGNEVGWIHEDDLGSDIVVGYSTYRQDGRRNRNLYARDSLAKNASTSPFVEFESQSSTYETERVWSALNDGSISWWTTAPVVRVGVSGVTYFYETTPIVNAGITYYYADIPVARSYANYVRLINNFSCWYNITNETQIGASGAVGYIKDNGSGGQYVTSGTLPNGTASTAAVVLEGYLTCSSNVANGYGAVQNLKNNFIDQLAEGEKDKMADVNLTDYAYHNTKETYSGSDVKNLTVTAAEKWAAMCALYNASNGTNYSALAMPKERSGSTPTAIVAALTSIGAAAAGAMIFVAKKRKEN